nr:MAG TPA: envelope glycoprotein [Caudoviricetes sp.]
MKCKWYADFEGVCTNGECPYCGGTCPTSEYPEVCKHAEEAPEIPRLSVAELVKTLRLCNSASCTGCALYGFSDCGSIINPQAADMLEKLAAEKKDEHKIKTPYARIYVSGTPEKPYYGITYFDLTDGEMHSGFGSYSLDFVFKWFAEEFEIAKPDLPKEEKQ